MVGTIEQPGGGYQTKTEEQPPMQSRLPMHLSPRCGARMRKGTLCRSPRDGERPLPDARGKSPAHRSVIPMRGNMASTPPTLSPSGESWRRYSAPCEASSRRWKDRASIRRLLSRFLAVDSLCGESRRKASPAWQRTSPRLNACKRKLAVSSGRSAYADGRSAVHRQRLASFFGNPQESSIYCILGQIGQMWMGT